MKKILCVLLSVFCILFCVGCAGDDELNISDETKSETALNATSTADDTDGVTTDGKEKKWGSAEIVETVTKNGVGSFFISLPNINTISRGGARIAQQTDGTLVLIGVEDVSDDAVPESLDKVVEFYNFRSSRCLDSFRNWDFENFDFVIKSTENVEINGYKMCKHRGTHTFTYKGEPYEMNFVAYAMQLNANNGYVYWIVIDETEEQGLSETIASHAENMAKSVVEEDIKLQLLQ